MLVKDQVAQFVGTVKNTALGGLEVVQKNEWSPVSPE
jgi:hypothetical protein